MCTDWQDRHQLLLRQELREMRTGSADGFSDAVCLEGKKMKEVYIVLHRRQACIRLDWRNEALIEEMLIRA